MLSSRQHASASLAFALIALVSLTRLALAAPGAKAAPQGDAVGPHVDHVILAVPNLERAQNELAEQLGVRAVVGGKHPGGTHNALLALGAQTYLELLALQPGTKGAAVGMPELDTLTRPEPVGWAVSAPDAGALRARLEKAGFALTGLEAGSRTTPGGAVLHWQTFGLASELAGAPFFIVWSAESPHPATTSPAGCTLAGLDITSPDAAALGRLVEALALDVHVTAGPPSSTLQLRCPKGAATFTSSATTTEESH